MRNFSNDRLRYGLQLRCIEVSTRRMELFTPRNLDVALAMVEGHAFAHGRGWEYRIEDLTRGSTFEPIWMENI